jgi:dTMP kinase
MAADRAQHVDEIVQPALEAGRWVVTDRYSGSTLAYQGWGRGLGTAFLEELVLWAAAGLRADLSILVDVPVSLARRRLGTASPDRLERLDEAFHDRVRHGFVAMARANPARWVVVDGTGEVSAVAEAVATAVEERLGRAPGSPRERPG